MNFNEYKELIKSIKSPEKVDYQIGSSRPFHPDQFSLRIISIETDLKVIKVPMSSTWLGKKKFITAIGRNAFNSKNKSKITDIILPPTIFEILPGTFTGCSDLKNIVIPRLVSPLENGVFDECNSLENIYYGGTIEQWNKIIETSIHKIEFGNLIPGTPVERIVSERLEPINEIISRATIHFKCDIRSLYDNDLQTNAIP